MKALRLTALAMIVAGVSSPAFAAFEADNAMAAENAAETLAETVAEAPADSVIVPRIYMGETVMAKQPVTFNANPDPYWNKVRFTGSISSEFLIPVNDKNINTDYAGDVCNNTYVDLALTSPYISVGGRFEFAKWPLPGFTDMRYRNWGVPYLWATGKYKWAQITAGDFYEQFGSGFILRSYYERNIGYDNAIRGGRVKLNPVNGLYITALGGQQRFFWDHSKTWLWGGDVEWSLGNTFENAFGNDYNLTLGGSYVGKHPEDYYLLVNGGNDRLRFPKNMAAFDGRAKLKLHDFSILLEGAYKNNDPNVNNGYTYKPGTAAMASVTYATKGFSAYVQAKRSENMSFRSDPDIEAQTNWYINHLPAFTITQTYALAALYYYPTQLNGEWAFQGEVRYTFKKKTPLGGKYGTNLRISGSYIANLDYNVPAGMHYDKPVIGSNGFGSAFWKIGNLFYGDLNIEINKKVHKNWQFTLFYLYQKFNQPVLQGHGEMLDAHTIILEGQWKMAKKLQLRFEAQYMNTKQDDKDWIDGLLELSFAPHWMFTVEDMYNIGGDRGNFYKFLVTYNLGANRFTAGFGRVKDGYNCSGGVCRWVPAYKGFTLTYNYTF